jgi:hypothetical protein
MLKAQFTAGINQRERIRSAYGHELASAHHTASTLGIPCLPVSFPRGTFSARRRLAGAGLAMAVALPRNRPRETWSEFMAKQEIDAHADE